MADKTVIRGDSYAIRRPLFTNTFIDDQGQPFPLAGCTIRTTYKEVKTSPLTDTTDESAAIKHELVVALDGTITTENGLVVVGDPSDGVVQEHLTADESLVLPLETPLISDVELTDANGEVFTWINVDTLTAIDGVTNRRT